MPSITITDNVTGEVKNIPFPKEEVEDAIKSDDEAERKPRKAGKKAQTTEQAER